MNDCTIEIIRDAQGLASIGPLWDRLVAESPVEHPFVTHAWVSTWWECFGRGELHIVIVRSGGQPIAIAPLMRITERRYGMRRRYLRFIANDHSPRCEFIVADQRTDAYAALCKYLMEDAAGWDIVALRDIPAGSRTLSEILSRSSDRGLLSGVRDSAYSPLLTATATWDQYLEALPAKRRWFLRNRLRRLEKRGEIELETITGGEQLTTALEDGYSLEAAAWKEKAGTAIRCQADVRRFYTLLAQRAADRGWLRLQFLKVGEQRIAFAYCLVYADRMFLLKPGFDPDYAAYSPGNLLCYLALQEVYSSGLDAYEFLGSDDHWKRQWTTHIVTHQSLFLYADRPLSRIAHYTRFALVPALQQVPFYTRLRDFVFGSTQ